MCNKVSLELSKILAAVHALPFFQYAQMRRQLPAHGSRQVVSGGNSCLTQEARRRATSLREDLERQATAAGPRGGEQPGTRGSPEPPCVCRAIPHLPAQLNAQRQTRRSRCRPRSTCLQWPHGAWTLPLGLTGPGHSRSIPRPPALQRHLCCRHTVGWRIRPAAGPPYPFTCFSLPPCG